MTSSIPAQYESIGKVSECSVDLEMCKHTGNAPHRTEFARETVETGDIFVLINLETIESAVAATIPELKQIAFSDALTTEHISLDTTECSICGNNIKGTNFVTNLIYGYTPLPIHIKCLENLRLCVQELLRSSKDKLVAFKI